MKRILKLLLIGVMVLFPNMVHAETLDVNSKEVQDLNKKYNIVTYSGDWDFLTNEYYFTSNHSVTNMPNNIFVELFSYNSSDLLHKIDSNGDIDYFGLTKEEYNQAFKDFYGPDINVKTYVKETGEVENCLALKYDSKTDAYVQGNCGSTGPGYYQYIKSASKDNNNIYINVKTYGPVIDEEIAKGKKYILPLDIFANGKDNTNMPVNSYDSKEVDQKYGEYLDTYKFTFKKASDGEYYFYSVENLNDAKEYKVNVSKGNTKVSNPKTADQNIIIISVVGIICLGIVIMCSKKILKH